MAHGRDKYGLDSRIACVSPLWKHTSGSSVVTLKMRPPASTPFTSLDTFMAAHSPRRFCQARQRYLLSKHSASFSHLVSEKKVEIDSQNFSNCLLEPLGFDKKITAETGFEPVNKTDERPKSRTQTKVKSSLHLTNNNYPKRDILCSPTASSSAQDSSSEQEQIYNRILHLGKCKLSTEDDLIDVYENQDKFKTGSFRPSTRLPFTFSRSASIPNSPRDTTDLIAIGTISMTSQRQAPTKPQSRWKTKTTLNVKGSKYPDPMAGAPPSFQSRMTEMAQLELETIKYEKGRKVKKKSPT